MRLRGVRDPQTLGSGASLDSRPSEAKMEGFVEVGQENDFGADPAWV